MLFIVLILILAALFSGLANVVFFRIAKRAKKGGRVWSWLCTLLILCLLVAGIRSRAIFPNAIAIVLAYFVRPGGRGGSNRAVSEKQRTE
jgi:hypothetical protein